MKRHKTTVVLDDELLKRAMLATGAKTKKQVIEEGLKYLIQLQAQNRLKEELGSYQLDLTLKELEQRRGEG